MVKISAEDLNRIKMWKEQGGSLLVKKQPAVRKKIVFRKPDVGHDMPARAELDKKLKESCQLVPADSPQESSLRRTCEIAFVSYVSDSVHHLAEQGVGLSFFTVQSGIVIYPALLCTNCMAYTSAEEFAAELHAFCLHDPTMEYSPELHEEITLNRLEIILNMYDEGEKSRCLGVIERISRDVQSGRKYRGIDFLGYDKTCRM